MPQSWLTDHDYGIYSREQRARRTCLHVHLATAARLICSSKKRRCRPGEGSKTLYIEDVLRFAALQVWCPVSLLRGLWLWSSTREGIFLLPSLRFGQPAKSNISSLQVWKAMIYLLLLWFTANVIKLMVTDVGRTIKFSVATLSLRKKRSGY